MELKIKSLERLEKKMRSLEPVGLKILNKRLNKKFKTLKL